MNQSRFGFIGVGNIASAIISGQIRSGNIKSDNIYIFDTDTAKCDRFVSYGINVCRNSKELVGICDYIFLTVKPQIYPSVLNEIKDEPADGKCFVDVGAGITIDFVKSILGEDTAVIRVMPNTPLLLCQGATALAYKAPVTDEQFAAVRGIFGACGVTEVVNEADINTVTAVSGSSPAFIFRFAQAMINAGTELGMDPDTAKSLVVQTVAGSAKMMSDSGMNIDELIKMVSSPNGTTVAGLKALDDTGFDKSTASAVFAAKNRADELSKG